MTEDEEFADLERRLKAMLQDPTNLVEMDRNRVLEEVAVALEGFTGAFGPDTVASFACFVRGMKR